jgi:hypothetical protein
MFEKLRLALFPLVSVATLLTLPVTSSIAEEMDKGVTYYVDSETGA